ncbi:MAG TPA: hypothetical protein VHA75_02775, partial [Rugosimonospora sp.]|nr:hypothetical protein [Rugosimonospora sp.]
MSHDGELLTLSEDANARPSFGTAVRGYDKRQVDQFVAQADSEVATLTAERERAYAQIRDLHAQLQHLQGELVELRQRPTTVERASFRHLGPMVDQILLLAEKQADTIAQATAERVAGHEAAAEKTLADAREHAAKIRKDLEEEVATRRADEDRAAEERHNAAQAELAAIREHAEQVRAEGEAAREAAVQEAQRIAEESAQQAEKARAD